MDTFLRLKLPLQRQGDNFKMIYELKLGLAYAVLILHALLVYALRLNQTINIDAIC